MVDRGVLGKVFWSITILGDNPYIESASTLDVFGKFLLA